MLPAVADRYALLDSGAALGRGNGPLLVRRAGDRSPIRRVAVPGVHTTANALMMRLFPRITERTPLLFSQIAAAVERGDFDAGVLIHEGRFVYRQRQLELVADLGQLWERTTALPLPLGGIAAKRSLPEAVRRQVETLIRQSIEYAFAHPEASRAYIKEHAQELDDAVIDAHIALFVNDYSLSLGDEGRRVSYFCRNKQGNKNIMAQGSRQVQTQAQQQIQTLSPQQILVVKLLELPTVELEERIHSEILDNPALEEGKEMPENEDDNTEYVENEDGNTDSNEDFSLGDYSNEDDIPDYKLQEHNRSKEGVAEEIPFSDAVSFYEILKDQLQMQELTPEQRDIAEYLIGSLDDDGLLRKNMESIMDELAIYRGIYTTEEELNKILEIIQDFDPAGIGARSLQECLLLQIQRKADSPLKQIELDIIGKCCDEFTRKNKERIIQKLGITEEQYNEAVSDLTKLNPRPGSSLGEAMGKNMQQIIPDFIVETYEDDTITLSLNNRNVPELRLSRQFTELLDEHTRNKDNQSKASKDALMFLKQKVDAAQGFINAVKQRQHTLLTTMQAIIDIQRPFFLEGDESLLKPMILKDVAERSGLDISTISRVSNSKYVQTNYGIYSLKFFFSDGYTTEDGEELSVREIKRILKECVDTEDKEKPYTDDELAETLKTKGYPIARRTVAKYRQQLNIPVARLRR